MYTIFIFYLYFDIALNSSSLFMLISNLTLLHNMDMKRHMFHVHVGGKEWWSHAWKRKLILKKYSNNNGNNYTIRASPPALSMWLQRVKFSLKKSKCTGLAQEIDFFAPNSCSWLWLVKAQHSCAPPKKSVINWRWLRFSISDWLIIMIGPGGLRFVVRTHMQFQLQFYWWGCPKKTDKLRHLILLSRLTYWAPVEMLLHRYLIHLKP